MNTPVIVPTYQDVAVEIIDGLPCTTSIQIARHFGKRHDNVLPAIKTLGCSPEFSALNFKAAEYLDAQGKPRMMYNITRDGFTMLAMGFTGKRAMVWKEAYIAAFNAMEAHLMIEADIASQPPVLRSRRWLVTVDREGGEHFEMLPNDAAVVTAKTLPEIVRCCFPEYALVRRDALLSLEVRQ